MAKKLKPLDSPFDEDEDSLDFILRANTSFSAFLFLVGVHLVYSNTKLYYYYHYTDILLIYIKSNLELGGEIGAGLFSIFSGIFCWYKYPLGLQMLFWMGGYLILFPVFLLVENLEYYQEYLMMSGFSVLSGYLLIKYSRWEALNMIYKS